MNFPGRLFLVLTIALTACATAPPTATIALQSAADFSARSLSDPGLKAYIEATLQRPISTWPPALWNEQTLSLAAFYYHPELAIARARWATARAAEIAAGGHPAPTLALLPEYNSDAAANVSPWTVSLSLNLPIETAGKRQYRLARARQLSAAARFYVATAAWHIHSRVRAALLELYAARESQSLLEQQVTLSGARLKAIEQRLAAGAASRPEATQAGAAFEQARFARRQAEQQMLAAQSALAQALGMPLVAVQAIELDFAAFAQSPAEAEASALAARQRALAGRPDLLAALAQYAASESALQLALSGRIPNVEIGPGYKWDEGAVKWSLGVALTLPVSSAGPIAEAAAQRDEAAARFNGLQAKVIGEIEQASAAYRLALQELDAAQAISSAAQQQLQAVEQQLRVGEADRLALLDARLQDVFAANARLTASLNVQRSFSALRDAMQQPLAPIELPIPYQDPRTATQRGSSQ
jgi:cobalt-zinc-cadmium efflux system outer membrane protein